MSYTPIVPATLVPGISGADDAWGALIANLDDAYLAYQPQQLCCATSLEVSSVTQTQVAEFLLPGNLDNCRVTLLAWWRGTTGYTATLTFDITDGIDSDQASTTSVSSSYAHSTVQVTPSSSTGPLRWGRVYLNSDSVQLARIEHLTVFIEPASYPTGLGADGAAKLSGWDLDSTSGAVPSEVVQRMARNVRALARARRKCLVSGLHRYGSGVPNYEVTGSSFQLVERFVWPGGDPARRTYRTALKLAGTDPEAKLVVGPYVYTPSASGWSYDTPELHLPAGLPGYLYARSTSGGTARVDTFQMFREPA